MEIYYTKEADAVIRTLRDTDREMPIVDLLEKASVDLIIAPIVISRLINEGKISYRMKDGVQHFLLMPEKSKPRR
jgi:hypothetical protein